MRWLAGAAVATVLLLAGTLTLVPLRDRVALPSVVLLFLVRCCAPR